MALELVTGYRGVLHITAPQDADLYRGLIGDGRLRVGNNMSVQKTGATEITVLDGVCVLDGREFYIGYEDSEIFSTAGMSGEMYLVITYDKDENRHENATLELVDSYTDIDIRTLPSMSQKLVATIAIGDDGTVEGVEEEIPLCESVIDTATEAEAAAKAAQEAADNANDAAAAATESVSGLEEITEKAETAAENAAATAQAASDAASAANEAAEKAETAIGDCIYGITLNGEEVSIREHVAYMSAVTQEQAETMIAEKIAEIVADAPASLDTLKEIADWIEHHEDDAAAMNSAIQTNAANIVTAQEAADAAQSTADGVLEYVRDYILGGGS